MILVNLSKLKYEESSQWCQMLVKFAFIFLTLVIGKKCTKDRREGVFLIGVPVHFVWYFTLFNIIHKLFYISISWTFYILNLCNSLFWPIHRSHLCRFYNFHQRACIFHMMLYNRRSCSLHFSHTLLGLSMHYNLHCDPHIYCHIPCKTRGSFSASNPDSSDIRPFWPRWRSIYKKGVY